MDRNRFNPGHWSDNDEDHKGNPEENTPVAREYWPDTYKEADDIMDKEIDPDALEPAEIEPTDCSFRQRYVCLTDALRLLRNQMSARDALIFIGRFYYKLKLKDLESIFRLDYTNISRVAQKAERKLKVRG